MAGSKLWLGHMEFGLYLTGKKLPPWRHCPLPFRTSGHFLWGRQCVTHHRITVLSYRKLANAKQRLPTYLLHWLWPIYDLACVASSVAVLDRMQRSQMVECQSSGMTSVLNTVTVSLQCGYGWPWRIFEFSVEQSLGIASIELAYLKDCLNRELLQKGKNCSLIGKHGVSQGWHRGS